MIAERIYFDVFLMKSDQIRATIVAGRKIKIPRWRIVLISIARRPNIMAGYATININKVFKGRYKRLC
jgi:hypothetical protein